MKKRKTLLLGILVLNLVACAKNIPSNISEQSMNNSQTLNNQISNIPLASSNISKIITNSVSPSNFSNTVITSKVAPAIVVPSVATQTNLTIEDTDIDEETKSVDIKDALVSYQDIDSIFLESENLSSSSQDKIVSSSSFGVKALIQNDIRFDSNKNNSQIDLRDAIVNQLKQIRDNKIKQDSQMSNSNQRTLENKKTITNNTYQKVDFHSKSEVKDSDEVILDNNEGTTIRDKEFEFNRNNITRINRTSKIYQKNTNNLTKLEHHFSAKHVNYIQEATRLISFDNLGGKVVNTECTTKFNDGKMTVLSERKTIDRFGNGIGIGLIKVIYISGKTFSYNFNTSATSSEQRCNVKDNKYGRDIEVIRDNKGKAKIKCNDETKVIDIDDEVNDYHPPVKPSHSPKPTIVPTSTPTPTPEQTPIVTPTPSVEITITPSPEVTPTATPITTSTPTIEPISTPTPVPTPTPSDKGNNGLGDTKDDDNETKGEDSSNPGHN